MSEDKPKMGRPTKLTEEVKHCIFDALTVKDLSIKDSAEACGIAESTIYKWFSEDKDFMEFSRRIREAKAHKIINRAENAIREIDFIDTAKEDKESVKLDITKARTVFDSYLRLAGKYNRKSYGDNIDVTSGGEKVQSAVAIVPNEKDVKDWGKK